MIYATIEVKVSSDYKDSIKNIQEEIAKIEEVNSVEVVYIEEV